MTRKAWRSALLAIDDMTLGLAREFEFFRRAVGGSWTRYWNHLACAGGYEYWLLDEEPPPETYVKTLRRETHPR